MRAWVRFAESPVEVDAIVTAWTPKVVHVEFTMGDGKRRRAWAWANAVTRKSPK